MFISISMSISISIPNLSNNIYIYNYHNPQSSWSSVGTNFAILHQPGPGKASLRAAGGVVPAPRTRTRAPRPGRRGRRCHRRGGGRATLRGAGVEDARGVPWLGNPGDKWDYHWFV